MNLSIKDTIRDAVYLYFQPLIWVKKLMNGIIERLKILITGESERQRDVIIREREAELKNITWFKERDLDWATKRSIRLKSTIESDIQQATGSIEGLHSFLVRRIEYHEDALMKLRFHAIYNLIEMKEYNPDSLIRLGINEYFIKANPETVYAAAIALKRKIISEDILKAFMNIDTYRSKEIIHQLYKAGIIGQQSMEGVHRAKIDTEEELVKRLNLDETDKTIEW